MLFWGLSRFRWLAWICCWCGLRGSGFVVLWVRVVCCLFLFGEGLV